MKILSIIFNIVIPGALLRRLIITFFPRKSHTLANYFNAKKKLDTLHTRVQNVKWSITARSQYIYSM